MAELEVEAGTDVVVSDADFRPELGARLVAAKGDVKRAVLDMAPRAGALNWQVGVGSSVGPGVDGEVDRLLALRTALLVGLSDRVSLSGPAAPGLGVRLGNPDSHEALVFGGFYDGAWFSLRDRSRSPGASGSGWTLDIGSVPASPSRRRWPWPAACGCP